VRASLRRLGPEPPTDGVLAAVAFRRSRIVRRRRTFTVVAAVVAVAIIGGSVAVAASSPDDPDRLVVVSPSTLPRPTTTASTSTSSTTTSTTTTPATTTSTTAPVDTTACTSEAVAVSLQVPVAWIRVAPECVDGFALVNVCDPAVAETSPEMPCPEGYQVLGLADGAWSIIGHSLSTCAEDIEDVVPLDIAVRFEVLRICSWDRLLAGALLEPGGLGPVRIGMTVAAIEAATDARIEVPEGDDAVGIGDCRWVGLGTTSQAVNLIIRAPAGTAPADLHRVAVVVSIFSYVGATERGIGLGDPESAVLAAYPQAEVLPNPWSEPDGRWISWPARDHPQAITFETDGARVTGVHAGRHMPEGCHP
jgi:hypothetical protein